MILYKYLAPDRIDVLKNGMIRFTQLSALNDPFDCRPRFLQSKDLSSVPPGETCCVESHVQGFQQALMAHDRKTIGLLCLTEKPNNLLMWAHYAQNHEGLVIGFDIEHEFFSNSAAGLGLKKVKYSLQRPGLPKQMLEQELKKQPGINPYGAVSAFTLGSNSFSSGHVNDEGYWFIKGSDWEYEEEWRLVRNIMPPYYLANTGLSCPVYLFPFPRSAVHSVILGCRGFSKLYPLLSEILNEHPEYSKVQIFRANTDSNNFSIAVAPFYAHVDPGMVNGSSKSIDEEQTGNGLVNIARGSQNLFFEEGQPTSVMLLGHSCRKTHVKDMEKAIQTAYDHMSDVVHNIMTTEEKPSPLNQYLSKTQSVDECFRLTLHLVEENRSEEVKAVIKRAIDLSPSRPEGLLSTGSFLREIGLYNESKVLLENAIEENPGFLAALYNLGHLYLSMNELWPAEASFLTALQHDPNWSKAKSNIGIIRLKKGNYSEAEAYFRSAITDDPTSIEPHINLATMFLSINDIENATKEVIATMQCSKIESISYQFAANIIHILSDNFTLKSNFRNDLISVLRDSTSLEGLISIQRNLGFDSDSIFFISNLKDMEPSAVRPDLDFAGVYKKLGDSTRFLKYLNIAREKVDPGDWATLACLKAIGDETDEAFEILYQAKTRGILDIVWLTSEPNLEWVRKDARFDAMLKELEDSHFADAFHQL
jgi:tetratricopeptide (TPR) repeat protein